MRGDFRLGDWIVSPRRESIRRGDRKVHVHPKPMAVLERLAAAGGEVVTRAELFEAVWPGVIVTDDALTQCIVELRKAFGDSARDQKIIKTVPKVGFCLLPPVLAPGSEEKNDGSKPVYFLAGLLATVLIALWLFWPRWSDQQPAEQVPKSPSIAVLPFVNMSPDQEQVFFSDGISEELTNLLAQTSGLKVISHTSASSLRGRQLGAAAIAGKLGVTHLLEGSVRHSGNRVRITVQLVDAHSDTHLWSQTYDRDLSGVFAIQDEIAKRVVDEVRVTLLGAYPHAEPVHPEAYRLYLLGNFHMHRWDTVSARKYFREALAIEPRYAHAHLAVARCFGFETFMGYMSPRDGYAHIRSELEAALKADRGMAEIHRPIAEMNFYFNWDWDAAEASFEQAVSQVPSDAHAHQLFAWFLTAMGRTEEAIETVDRAIELEPLATPAYVTASNVYYMAGDYDQAIAMLRKALELAPQHALVKAEIGWNLVQLGRVGEAVIILENALALDPENTLIRWSLGHAYAVAGRPSEARRVLDDMHGLAAERYVLPFGFAVIHAGLGEKERALHWLEKAYEERNGWMVYLAVEPRLDPLRSEPGFEHLLKRMNFPD